MRECISHHHACDCREAMFKELVETFDTLLFECADVLDTKPPSKKTYNKALFLIKKYKEQT